MGILPQSALINILLFVGFDSLRFLLCRVALSKGIHFFSFTFLTAIVSLIFFCIALAPFIRQELMAICRNTRALLLVLGINIWHNGVAGTLLLLASKFSSAPNVAFIVQVSLIFNIIWEILFFKDRPNKFIYLLAFFSFTGLWMIMANGLHFNFHWFDLIALLAAFCFSLTDSLSRHVLNNQVTTPEVIAFFRPIGILILWPLFYISHLLYPTVEILNLEIHFQNLSLIYWSILTGLSMSLTWIFVNRSYQKAKISTVCMVAMLKPVLVLLLSVLLIGEGFGFMQLLGGALIIASSSLYVQKFLPQK